MYACSADPSLSDCRSWLHSGPLWWKAINQNKALAVWWKMSWVCWGGAIYRPAGIYYRGWDRRDKMANTPGITELGKIHHEVKASIRAVQGERGCDRQNSSCASSLQLQRVSSWLCVCRAWCWLIDSAVYPKQQSLALSWRLCNSIPASAVAASASWTSGPDFTCPYLLPVYSRFMGICNSHPLLVSHCCQLVSLEISDQLMQNRKQNGRENLAWVAGEIIWRCSFGVPTNVIGEAPMDFTETWTKTQSLFSTLKEQITELQNQNPNSPYKNKSTSHPVLFLVSFLSALQSRVLATSLLDLHDHIWQ